MNIQTHASVPSFNQFESVVQTNGKYTKIANPTILVRDAQSLTSRTAGVWCEEGGGRIVSSNQLVYSMRILAPVFGIYKVTC